MMWLQGRQFPVEVFYTPEPEDSYMDAALNTVLQVSLSLDPLRSHCGRVNLLNTAPLAQEATSYMP